MMMADHGTVTWIGNCLVETSTGHHPLIGGPVTSIARIPATQQGKAIELLGHVGNDFCELDSRNRRVDNTEFTPYADRRFWLWIKRVVVTGAATRPDQYAVHVGRVATLGSRLGSKQGGQGKPQCAEASQLQETSTRDTITTAKQILLLLGHEQYLVQGETQIWQD